MVVSRLTVETSDEGRKFLSGSTLYDVKKGTILVLRKVTETEWNLVAIDKRKVDTSEESLKSFVEISSD